MANLLYSNRLVLAEPVCKKEKYQPELEVGFLVNGQQALAARS